MILTVIRTMGPFKTSLLPLADFCRKACECVFRLRPRSDLGQLAALPPEMVLEVMKHLDDVSQFSLALTCRTFFRQYLPPVQSLGASSKQQLLFLLEKDVPGLYYCFCCEILHRWKNKSWARAPPPKYGLGGVAYEDCLYESSSWHLSGICFHFVVARTIMNRHLLGRKHGLSLSALHFTKTRRARCGGSRASMVWKARVIDDELVVMCTTKLWNKKQDARTLRRWVEKTRHHVCAHLRTDRCDSNYPERVWSGRGFSVITQLDELRADASSPTLFVPCSKSMKSCPRCMTDYCIDIQETEKTGWTIKIETYYNLGSLRTPQDWQWEVLREVHYAKTPPRMSRDPEQAGPGVVRRGWTAGDGMTLAPGGEWAQLRRL